MTQEELSKYISSDRLAHLEHQQTLFDAAKSELLQTYPDQYVAFEDGQVLDHDLDDRAMAERVYHKYGYRDILMQWVTEEETVYHVGGTHQAILDDTLKAQVLADFRQAWHEAKTGQGIPVAQLWEQLGNE
jgi:hypothetical protein